MDKDLSFAEDLELKLDGKRPIRRENPKKDKVGGIMLTLVKEMRILHSYRR